MPPQPGPCRSWLDGTKALGSRKCLGPSWGLAWQSLLVVSSQCQTSLLLSPCPPCYPNPCGAGGLAQTVNEPPGPLIPCLQSGLGFLPNRPEVSLAQPWPVLRPPWLHSHILLPAQGTEKLLALPKTLCAL